MGSDSRWYTFVDLRSIDEATKAVNTFDERRMRGGDIEVRTVGGAPKKVLQQIIDTQADQGEITAA